MEWILLESPAFEGEIWGEIGEISGADSFLFWRGVGGDVVMSVGKGGEEIERERER